MIRVKQAVRGLLVPAATRNRQDPTHVPSLEEFISCSDAQEFKALEPETEDEPITDLLECSSSFWLHPEIFLGTGSPRTVRAGDFALN